MTASVQIFDCLPPKLLECESVDLASALGGPALLRLEGRKAPAVFVSVLLHGNETSGWDGVRRYLRDHDPLSRSIDLFIGNVDAAAEGLRVLPGQQDFNRLWCGTHGTDSPESVIAAALKEAVGDRRYFAAIDLHNNTGHNPYYSVLTEITSVNCGLALAFSDKAVLVEEPDTTLTHWLAATHPAITLETGPVGDPRCADRVVDYLKRLLESDEIEPARTGELDLFQALARVHVRDEADLCFESSDSGESLVLTGGVEAVNFHDLPAGTVFASTERELSEVLQVLDPLHRDVTDRFFERQGNDVVLRTPVVPAMYTTDPYVIRQDCLCYFMRRV